MKPLVSVICLCHNHEKFVEKAIQSVFDQTYSNIELIVVDDASRDAGKDVIGTILECKEVEFFNLSSNLGITKAFNLGFQHSKGKYIIDLSADDVLTPERVERQVEFFEQCEENVGVIYSDAEYIDEDGNRLEKHFFNGRYTPYQGNIYEKLISTYFIPPPAMMMKREVLEEIGGYDEGLAYEDFDFWIRSSRKWHYQYQPESLTLIRRTNNSLSSKAYERNDKQLNSTYLVCQKIKSLNRSELENIALLERLKYEIKHSVFSANFYEAGLFINLYKEMKNLPVSLRLLSLVNRMQIDFSFLRKIYLKWVR